MHKDGKDIEEIFKKDDELEDVVFVLGDHIGIGEEDEKFLEEFAHKVSLSPLELHANHCITLVHNVLDKRLIK